MLLTLLLGAWAMQAPALAAALGVTVAVVLVVRGPIHHFVQSVLTDKELKDLLLLAVATLLILPLMPDRSIGPYGAIHPRALWLVVILVMSIAAAGHVALRVFGSRWGLPLAGLLGGFVSSTATIGAMGTRARDAPALLLRQWQAPCCQRWEPWCRWPSCWLRPTWRLFGPWPCPSSAREQWHWLMACW